MGSRCGSPSLFHGFFAKLKNPLKALVTVYGGIEVYILAKYRFSALSGLFAAAVNPYHLGAAFIARPRTVKKPTLL
jgi:hypothetical protein